jgi:hypothetical protein
MPEPEKPQSGSDATVSFVHGDRLCIRCGYNLLGQPVVRERHYEMLIVRCPECGTVASIQEYPLLGRWANRWAALLAALWFLVLVVLLFVTSIQVMDLAWTVGNLSCRSYADAIAAKQTVWLNERGEDPSDYQYGFEYRGAGYYTLFDPDFKDECDFDALLAERGGWVAMTDWPALLEWPMAFLYLSPLGAVWSVALIHIRRGWLAIPALVILGVAFAMGLWWGQQMDWMMGVDSCGDQAHAQIGRWFTIASLIFAFFPLMLGMVLGRPVVRLFVRLLLPPRMRGALAILWTAEGLPPPRPRPRRT